MQLIVKLFFCLFAILILPLNSADATDNRKSYEQSGKVFWEANITDKVVAITFDDGPHPEYTLEILDILAKHDAKATFFVTGEKIEAAPTVLTRTAKEGHEIGNHTYHHVSHVRSSLLEKELEDTSTLIESLTGKRPSIYRPVGGFYNEEMINTAANKGYKVILWSWHQDARDWRNPSSNSIANHIAKNLSPGDNILLHDWSTKRQTVQALDMILENLDKQGYKCVTVSELIELEKSKDNDGSEWLN